MKSLRREEFRRREGCRKEHMGRNTDLESDLGLRGSLIGGKSFHICLLVCKMGLSRVPISLGVSQD